MRQLKRRLNRRGSVLLLSVFFMVLLYMMSAGVLLLTPTEASSATRQNNELNAFYAADAGIQEGIEHIRRTLIDGKDPVLEAAPKGTLPSNWSYTTRIEKTPFGVAGVRSYRIIAEALRDGKKFRRVTATVIEDSWLKFNLFLDGSATLTENLNWEGLMKVDGVLTLDIKNIEGLTNPIFDNRVEVAQSSNTKDKKFQDGISWKSDSPDDAADYDKIFEDGKPALIQGAAPATPPETSYDLNNDKEKDILDLLAKTAYGSTSVPADKGKTRGLYVSNSTVGGLYPQADAGIYISGSVQSMELGTRNGNPSIRIKMPGETFDDDKNDDTDESDFSFDDSDLAASDLDGTNRDFYLVTYVNTTLTVGGITLDASKSKNGGYTVVTRPDGTNQIYDGLTNGVVYVSKKIKQLGGTESGLLTIAAGKEIKVTDEIDHRGNPPTPNHSIIPNVAKAGLTVEGLEPGQAPSQNKVNLALVSRKLKVKFKTKEDKGRPDQFYLYANLIATDKFKGNLKKNDALDMFGSLLIWNDKTKKKTKIFNKKSDIDMHWLGLRNYAPGIPGMGNFHVSSYVENVID